MRYCGHFLIKAEGRAKNYERDHPLPLAWRPFTVVFLQRKGYTTTDALTKCICVITFVGEHGAISIVVCCQISVVDS